MIIFYCWQSDLPNNVNRGFIQDCLEQAAKTIRTDDSIAVEPVISRDTEGLTGAPDIAETILQRIDEAAIVVADVSLVAAADTKRPAPNPNVLVEVGYALKGRGRERLILIMNRFYGSPEQLPFDLRRYRVLPYDLAPDRPKADVRRVVTRRLVDQIQEVVRVVEAAKVSTPPVPFDQEVRKKLQADAESIRPVIFEARDAAVDAWRSTEGGSAKAVQTVRDEHLRPALDRLMTIGMLVPNYNPRLFQEVVDAFVRIYGIGGQERYGSHERRDEHFSWTLARQEVLRRILLIGFQLVRDDHLALLPTLVLQHPDPHERDHAWIRQAHILLARHNRLAGDNDLFQEVRATIAEPSIMLPTLFDRDPLRLAETFARFDFLQYLICIVNAGHHDAAYPTFGSLHPHLLTPVVERLIQDRTTRESLKMPTNDGDLASLLGTVNTVVQRRCGFDSNWYGFPPTARIVWDFINAHKTAGRSWE